MDNHDSDNDIEFISSDSEDSVLKDIIGQRFRPPPTPTIQVQPNQPDQDVDQGDILLRGPRYNDEDEGTSSDSEYSDAEDNVFDQHGMPLPPPADQTDPHDQDLDHRNIIIQAPRYNDEDKSTSSDSEYSDAEDNVFDQYGMPLPQPADQPDKHDQDLDQRDIIIQAPRDNDDDESTRSEPEYSNVEDNVLDQHGMPPPPPADQQGAQNHPDQPNQHDQDLDQRDIIIQAPRNLRRDSRMSMEIFNGFLHVMIPDRITGMVIRGNEMFYSVVWENNGNTAFLIPASFINVTHPSLAMEFHQELILNGVRNMN